MLLNFCLILLFFSCEICRSSLLRCHLLVGNWCSWFYSFLKRKSLKRLFTSEALCYLSFFFKFWLWLFFSVCLFFDDINEILDWLGLNKSLDFTLIWSILRMKCKMEIGMRLRGIYLVSQKLMITGIQWRYFLRSGSKNIWKH